MEYPVGSVLAVDVGGTTIKGALVAGDGAVLREAARPTPLADGSEGVIAAIVAMLAELAPGAPAGRSVRAAALVVPGMVDARAGMAIFAGNLGFRDLPLRDRIAAATGLPVVLEHDVRAAGLAERTVGAARGIDDHIVVPIGTGIAAVVHAGGRPLSGARGIAGELGHAPVWPGGEPCACGQRGCLERYASASAIVRRYVALGGEADATAADVCARRANDPAAARAWGEATEALAIALVTCSMVLDPTTIVLAGGLSEAGAALVEPVRSQLAARLTWREPPDVRLSPLGSRAGLAGAALLAWRQLGCDPGVGGGLSCGPSRDSSWSDWYSPIAL